MKRWAPRLALRKRLKVIRKWPIAALQCLPALFKLKNAPAPDADKHFIVVVEVGALPD